MALNEKQYLYLIFIHGWLSDKRLWRKVIGNITMPVRVINFELGGYGDSTYMLQQLTIADLQPSAQAFQLHKTLSEKFALTTDQQVSAADRRKTGHPILLVSHSMGSLVVQEFLAGYGAKYNCQGWIMCAGLVPSKSISFDISIRKFVAVPVISEMLSLIPNSIAVVILKWILYIGTFDSMATDMLMQWLIGNEELMNYGLVSGLMKQLRALIWFAKPWDETIYEMPYIMEKINGRLSIVAGTQDYFRSQGNTEEFMADIKSPENAEKWTQSVELVKIKSGHFIPLTHPVSLVKIIETTAKEIAFEII